MVFTYLDWPNLPSKAIKDELKRRGEKGYSGLSKEELVSHMKQVLNDERFPLRKLPLELQPMIASVQESLQPLLPGAAMWKAAIPPRRAVIIQGDAQAVAYGLPPRIGGYPDKATVTYANLQHIRNLLVTCKESKEIVLKVCGQPQDHQLTLKAFPHWYDRVPGAPVVKTYCPDDVFFFTNMEIAFSALSATFLEGVKYIGILHRDFQKLCGGNFYLRQDENESATAEGQRQQQINLRRMDQLLRLPNLEEIIVTGDGKKKIDYKVSTWGTLPVRACDKRRINKSFGDQNHEGRKRMVRDIATLDIKWITRTGDPTTSLSRSLNTLYLSRVNQLNHLHPLRVVTVLFMEFAEDVPGVPGIQGIQGVPNIQAIQGVPGIQGVPNIHAHQGVQGIQGVPGIRAIQDVPEVQGFPDIQGDQNIPGIQGIQDVPGIMEARGDQEPELAVCKEEDEVKWADVLAGTQGLH